MVITQLRPTVKVKCLNEYMKYLNHYNKCTYGAVVSFSNSLSAMSEFDVSLVLNNIKAKNRSL